MTITESGWLLLLPVVLFTTLAFWKLHPVLFILLSGVTYITGCYAADILTNGLTNPFSLTAALAFIMYGICCIGFAFMTMFKGNKT